MGEYEDTLRDIEKNLGMVPGFVKNVPEDTVIQHWPLFKKYTLGESKIPAKYRELMGLAVAANAKCPYCQLFHKTAAKLRGATEEELAETAFLASYFAAWGDIMHAQDYDYDTFSRELQQITEHLRKEPLLRRVVIR